jgi:hypothetical protein
MAHPEQWVRGEAYRLVEVFSRPAFRYPCALALARCLTPRRSALETGIRAAPWLFDALHAEQSGVHDTTWSAELEEFLVGAAAQHAGCVGWMWALLARHYRIDPQQHAADAERLLEWRNHVRTLCLALRPGAVGAQPRQVECATLTVSVGTAITPPAAEAFLREIVPLIHVDRDDGTRPPVFSVSQSVCLSVCLTPCP